MRAGKLRHRIRLLRLTGDRDEFGGITDKKTVVSQPWCEILEVQDSEQSSKHDSNTETLKFCIRYAKSLENPDNTMYIEYNGVEYEIISVENYLKLNKKLHIVASRR